MLYRVGEGRLRYRVTICKLLYPSLLHLTFTRYGLLLPRYMLVDM